MGRPRSLIIILFLLFSFSVLAETDMEIYKPERFVFSVPTTASDACTAGSYSLETGFAYFCVAADTWERVVIATWAVATEQVIFAAEDIIFAAEAVVYP